MLVLTRKLNEYIIIDNKIRLTILNIRGDQVRIGIEAPPTVKIYRSEVWETIRSENISSRGITDESLEKISQKIKKREMKSDITPGT